MSDKIWFSVITSVSVFTSDVSHMRTNIMFHGSETFCLISQIFVRSKKEALSYCKWARNNESWYEFEHDKQ